MHMMESILKEFGEKIGVNDFAFDADKFCTLYIEDESITLRWQQDTETLLAYSVLLQCAEGEYNPALLRLLLEANLFGDMGPGMNIGLHEGAHAFVLSCTTSVASLTLSEFEAMLTRVTEAAAFWRRRLELLAGAEGEEAQAVATDCETLLRC